MSTNWPQQQADADELITLITKPTEFEAHAIAVVLRDAGIDAVAVGTVHAALPFNDRRFGVPVQVRRCDAERATEVLKANAADSVDLDWEQVEVGDRVDSIPLTDRKGLPPLALLGFVIVAIILLGMIIAGLAAGLSLF